MKNEIERRVFVKKLAGLSLGACVIPKSLFFCKYNYELFNTHNSTAESEVHCQVDWQKMMKNFCCFIWKYEVKSDFEGKFSMF